MATKAHCAFCFESLSASFERRQPLSLAEVEDLWDEYHTSKSNGGKAAVAAEPDNDNDEDENEDEEDDDEIRDAEAEVPSTSSPTSSARPAAISRLLNHDRSSAASSSSSLRSSGSGSASSSSKEASAEARSGSSTPASSNTSLRSRISAATKRRKRSAGGNGDEEQYPLFVTWNTISRSGGGKSLRGCIGTFEAQGLESGLRSYALTSAFEDVRFQPIPSSLLPRLSAYVTLLTNFTSPTPDPYAWTLGKHGIRISFTHRGRRLGATYLPDVASEQGWTVDETLVSLMRKAGWSGSRGDWKKVWREGRGELVTYEGAQCGLGFEEWRVWREWVDSLGVRRERLN